MKKLIEKIKYLMLAVVSIIFSVKGIKKTKSKLLISLYFIVIAAAVSKMSDRDYFLPFLGDSVFPIGVLKETLPDKYDTEVLVTGLPSEVKVVYWASNKENETNNEMPWTAYGKYSNSGVTLSDNRGEANFKVMFPRKYKTPWGKCLKNHVHYRYFLTNGMMSRVFTKYI